MYLLDINVWLALAFSQHKHHTSAHSWFGALPTNRQCNFCRYTQRGFLRLSTNPKSNPLQTQTMTQAWAIYDGLLRDPRIGFLAEPDVLESHWRQFSQLGSYSHNLWNDAYLAAFALAGNYEVVTFDKGFAQFPGLAATILP